MSNQFHCTIKTTADDAKWDAFVDAHPQGTPYHKTAWMKAIEESYGQKSTGIVVRDVDANNAIVGVVPLVEFAVPFKGKALISLPYCDVGAVLLNDARANSAVNDFLFKLNDDTHARYVELRYREQESSNSTDLTGKKVCMLLSLEENAEKQLASFKSKLRSQIRKAEKNGLTFKTGSGASLLKDFYHVYTVNMRDLGSPVHHIDWFKSILGCYAESALLSVVYLEDEPVGAGLVLKNQAIACIPWASTIQSYNRLAPNMLLYWSVLAHCADAGIATFDFGRSTFNEGTFKFKKQWGANPVPLKWRTFVQHKEVSESAGTGNSDLRRTIEAVWKKLPLGLTIKLGATVRPYISL